MDVAADLSLVFDYLRLFEEGLPGQEKFNMVKGLDFFNNFSEPEIWEVINAANWLEFEPEDEIISEGDADNSFYVVTAGNVRVTKGGQDLHELHAGDCFGEMGFIAGKKRTANIIARTKVTALKIRAALMERASLHCQLQFHKVFLNALVERLSHTTDRVSDNPA
jgi:CRP-like cAMP-binding protein